MNVSRVSGEEDEVTCVGSSEPHKLGPIDKWTRPIDPKSTQAEALKQQKLNKELWKQRTHEVQQYVARWMYTHGNSLITLAAIYYSAFHIQVTLLFAIFNTHGRGN